MGTHFPTKFSKTELFPADWPPTTAICGRSSCICTPSCVKASCNLLTIGINCSIPIFPDMAAGFSKRSTSYELHRRSPLTDFSYINKAWTTGTSRSIRMRNCSYKKRTAVLVPVALQKIIKFLKSTTYYIRVL